MFEIFDKNNKISDEIAKKIYAFMIDNYCNRKEYLNRPRSDFDSEENYDRWLNMLRTFNDYYTLVYYQDNNPVAFISYSFMEKGLCLCEVQIKEEYQEKYNILRKMLEYILNITKSFKYNNICGGINNNQHSVDVFTHIGMKNTEKTWYEISVEDLMKWITKD